LHVQCGLVLRHNVRMDDSGHRLNRTTGAQTPQTSVARGAGALELDRLLRQTRQRTLALAQDWKQAAGSLAAPFYAPELNPPLWELGHMAWFMERWTLRHPERHLGCRANPLAPLAPSRLKFADDGYDSSAVAHAQRWQLPLAGEEQTLEYLALVLEASLKALSAVTESDDALYFWRLCLMHEAMHNEAWVFMAQVLNIRLSSEAAFPGGGGCVPATSGRQIAVAARQWRLGAGPVCQGFAFDNELGERIVHVDAFEIDDRPVSWAQYLHFVEATGHPVPGHVRCGGRGWEQRHLGEWRPLQLGDCAVYLGLSDAMAWCAWAGRQLPTEAQWAVAAVSSGAFAWGQVWEWTASVFEPYEGFVAHPYRDYSMPWFGSHQVLRGASRATSDVVRDWRYRNYFLPERRDVYSGFRSVTPAQKTAKR
jgi:gamma-glutamyl hercynylcysteine S-oxide synthase